MNTPIVQRVPKITKGVPWYKRGYRWLFGPQKWRVAQDFVVEFRGHKILVPKGFITDFASVPKLFWPILSPTGILQVPALLHDYYYTHHCLLSISEDGTVKEVYKGKGKAFGDKIFKDVAKLINGMSVPNAAANVALGAFGWPAWWKHRRRDTK